jgi:hypothetical protein
MESIELFLSKGSGDGDGGSGDGDGDSGDGYGSGSGYGYGYGDGSGDGDGDGSGSGYGSGIKSINGQTAYEIDDVQTVIYSIHRNIARGAILNKDLTLSPCYIAKVDYLFAHGKTAREAVADATNKALQAQPIEERINSFVAKFGTGKHPAKDYMDWHGILTGSCKMGRESFAKNNGIVESDLYTIADFVGLTKNAYGGDVVKQIEKLIKQ